MPESWKRIHWGLFAIVSASFFLDGVLFTLVPATIYLIEGLVSEAPLIFAVNSLFFMLGALVLGWVGDVLGRRLGLITSLLIYTAGAVAFAATFWAGALTLPVALATTSVINFGVGGEVGPAYSALAELTPPRRRGTALMLAANFWNVGAAILAAASLYYAELTGDPKTAVLYTFYTAIALAVLVLVARLHVPESLRWLAARGRLAEAEALAKRYGVSLPPPQPQKGSLRGYWGRIALLAVAFTAQLITYNIAAYYVPYAPGFAYGAEFAPINVAVANLGAAVGAFLLLPLIDKSRKLSFTAAFAGGLATAIALAAVHGSPAWIYASVLFLNLVFSEWAWASISVLESELFPTAVRSTAVGLVTAGAWLANAGAVFLEGVIGVHLFLALLVALWSMGLTSALWWQMRGVESAGRELEELA
ncbi:Sugar (and other) transporter [Pyrobaculum oguniense TE7]|uniref:Sugar (And other) transporter n=1 Tax=Pyrobaculum oguniense (strain DSM 13380 / JCM 10595 / TE7) TaxID=698757 RepID=H6QDV0_PYROT|nr:Sugar (and other) transporter [Pyrobaculum oguniense TE7]